MGAVYLAQQTEPVKRAVAVKVIKAGMDSKAVLARFEAERQALAMMDHPNIAKVLDAGTTDGGRPFFVMELVKGLPITQYCDERRLTPKQRLELFVPVCQAIQHAHQKGVIHRDIKPSNVLVAMYDDRAVTKVIDFGVAKAAGQALTDKTLMTGLGAVVGTAEYMSPEQASLNNLDIDTRSDVYSLGVLLYELLTGSTPVDRKSLGKAALLEVLRIVREVEAPLPSAKLSTIETLASVAANRGTEPAKLSKLMKGDLDWLVLKALEKDRSRRYETANALGRDIQRYLSDEVVEARPPSAAYRLRKFVKRNRAQVIAASLVLLALLAGMVGTTWGLLEARRSAKAERIALDDAVEQKRLAEGAAEEERHAKVREAVRADGERRAKTEADARRQEAERNLSFAEKGNEILGSVFDGLDPKAKYETVAELRNALGANLRKAVRELDGAAIGDPLAVAQMQHTLGRSLVGLGESKLAVEVLQKALATRKARLGPDHPQTLNSTNYLVQGYLDAGRLDKALPLCEETLTLAKAKFGPNHPHTLASTNNMALAYIDAGRRDEALPLYEEALALAIAKHGPDDPRTLTCMQNLAGGYRVAGQPAKALPLLEKVLAQRKAKLGPEHPDTLQSMGALAGGYRDVGALAKALPLYEETLGLAKAKLGPDHPYTLKCMNNLATCYWSLRRLDRSVPLLEQALAVMEKKLGRDHPDTLGTVSNLGVNYRDAGQVDKALPLLEEALSQRKAKLGPDHPYTLGSMHFLAQAYLLAGRPNKALPLWEEALALAKAKLGPDHAETLQSMGALAEGYRDAGRPAKALLLYEETLTLSKAKLGPDHPYTLKSMHNLATCYWSLRRLDKSVPLLEQALALQEKKLGHDHPDTLSMVANLGANYRDAGQVDKALPLLEEALTQRKAELGPDHPDTLASMNNLAQGHLLAGRPNKALPLWEEALTLAKARFGPDHPETLKSMQNLGRVYQDGGQVDKALPLVEKILAQQKARLGPDHPDTLASMCALAGCYHAAGRTDEAVRLYEEALPLNTAKLGPDHSDTLWNMHNLAACYWSLKRLDKSVPLLEKLLPIREKKLGRSHEDTLRTVGNLGVNYRDAGRVTEAIPLLEEAHRASKKHASLRFVGPALLNTYGRAGKPAAAAKLIDDVLADARRKLPKDSPQLAGLLAQSGVALMEMSGFAEADALLRECLSIRAKAQPDHWSTFNAMAMHGRALLGQRKYADAEPLLVKGYEGMKAREKAIPPQAAANILEALDRLIDLYAAVNKPDEVKKWRTERAKYSSPAAKSPAPKPDSATPMPAK